MKKRIMKKHIKEVNRKQFVCDKCKQSKDYKQLIVDDNKNLCLTCVLKGE